MKNKLILMTVLLLIGFVSCKKEENEGACNEGQDHYNHKVLLSEKLQQYIEWNGDFTTMFDIYYTRNIGSKVTFFIGDDLSNICTKTHVKVSYYCVTSDSAKVLPMKIYGEGFWSNYDEKIVLHDGVPTAGEKYSKIFEFGLKQAFGEQPGNIKSYLTVEFDRHATLAEDIAYFEKHIKQLSISYDYDIDN